MKRIVLFVTLFAALVAVCLPGCNPVEEPDGSVKVSSITLNETSYTLEPGQTLSLVATVNPSAATDKTVTWTSSNTSVASVSNGTVTALAEGNTTITASAGGKSAQCAITVIAKSINATSISLDRTKVVLDVFGDPSCPLKVILQPENASAKDLLWSSDNKSIVSVDGNGNITAVAEGTATITATLGSLSASCTVTVKEVIKKVLMDLYNSTDGPNWKTQGNWATDKPFSEWKGVWLSPEFQELHLIISQRGLKGKLPESLGDLADWLTDFQIGDEPDLTGTLPESFAKLTKLQDFRINRSGVESLPDVFSKMHGLKHVSVSSNPNLTGPIPESIGSSDVMEKLTIVDNYFTGSAYGSWIKLGDRFSITNNCLSGTIPPEFLDTREHLKLFVDNALNQKPGYGFDITDVDIPGSVFWPDGSVKDLYGDLFTFDDVISKNKYTVYFFWAPWCSFSQSLLPRLKKYYDIYKQDGLEVIATVQLDKKPNGSGSLWSDFDGQKKEVDEKGYDVWYNYYFPDYFTSFLLTSPNAEVYDQNGNVLFSSINSYPDPVRKRFNKVASSELIPFLESILGPEEPGEPYSSKDFSKDGEVMTLQKATVGKGINVVFMGDGYTDKDMGPGGYYETLMKDAMEEFFDIEPYKSFRNRFNVYAVKVVSLNDRIGGGYSTALETYLGTGTSMGGNNEKCYEYALKVPGITSINDLLTVVMVNSRNSSGAAHMSAGSQSSIAYVADEGNQREFYGPVLRHECGHGFAFLADEYVTHSEEAPENFIDNYNKLYEAYGWYPNVDFTNSPEKVKWSVFLSDDRYKDEVGIFEGGATYLTGAYKPSRESMMNENTEYFNAPSRWAIYKQIMKRSGEEPSFEKFLEYDAINRGKAKAAAKSAPKRKREPSPDTVIIP